MLRPVTGIGDSEAGYDLSDSGMNRPFGIGERIRNPTAVAGLDVDFGPS
jgi:hypothetical protein